MKSQRLLECLLLLQGARRQTAGALATRLGVSVRTIYRDVDELSSAGVPVYMERGPQGGVVLSDDYRRALAQFTGDELQALFAATTGPMADIGIVSQPAALQKLAGALPTAQRLAAERGRERLLLDHNKWYRGEQPTELLGALRAAVADERVVRMRYRDRSGSATERAIEPLGLVAKAGVWYLVARDIAAADYRSFRAQRIVEATATTARFVRPAGFDLEAYWRSSIAYMEKAPNVTYDVTLRVRVEAYDRLNATWGATLADDETPGFARVGLRFPSIDAAVYQVVALGEAVLAIEPPELTVAVVARARETLALFG
ncbi:MAG: YafY family transcriptional regulator [Candidatus Eremiobacteraeota bacterium]|nr:YafY family transcriptional regulator [Candidatus Eremiobacteraeota bacterium]